MAGINVDIPDEMSRQIAQIVETGGYATQSEFVREALRNFIAIKLPVVPKVEKAAEDLVK